ncbi:MAG: hypothetical protein ACPGUZ_02720 [Holosporaceae bacterium]
MQSKRVNARGFAEVYKTAPQNCENPGANHSRNVCDRLPEKQAKILPNEIAKSDSKVDHSFHFMKLPVELQRYIVCLAALDWQSADTRLLKGNYVTLDELRQNGFKLSKGALALREVSRHFNQLMMDHGKGPGCLSVFTPSQQSDVEACLLGPYPRVVRLKDEGLRCVMQDSFLKKLSKKKSETLHWPSRIEVFMDSERNIESLSTLALHETLSQRVVSVKIKECNTERLEGLKKLQHLKSLLVEVSSLSNMNGLKDCRNLSRIVIKAMNLSSIKGMQNLPALEDLHIISFDLPDTVSDLANLPTLRELSIISRIKNVEQIKSLTQLKELSIISDNNGFYKAYQNWVRESCCNEFASETKHRFDSDTDDSDDSEIEDDYDDSEIEDDYDDIDDKHDHCGKGLTYWDFFIKKDLHSFLTNDKNCKTYEGTIDDLTDDLCENNTIISLKRP